MHRSTALLFATTLSLLPVAVAQTVETNFTAATDSELRFQIGDLQVRRWNAAGVAKAASSRDGGRTWSPLADPDDRLHFVLAVYDPRHENLALPGAMGAPTGNRLFVVQFQTQILAEYQDLLRQRGIEILHYMPENALLVRGDRTVLEGLRTVPCVRWFGDLQNGFKLSDELRNFAQAGAAEPMECNLVLAQKADRGKLIDQVAKLGGVVTHPGDGSVLITARLAPAQLLAVVALDTVVWADPVTPVGHDMNNARIQGGADYVETQGGFTGNGVRAEITEFFEEFHPDFQNLPSRVLIRNQGVDNHGHCTAGIVGGAGVANAGARGMLPSCTMIEGGYTSTAAHYAQATGSTNPANAWHTMVATASWGAGQTTQYTSISQAMDNALFDSDLTRFQSQSNLGSQSSRPEAWAKNVISGGGIVHANNPNPATHVTSSASFGPAADGRLKPDICAYYDGVLTSDRSGTSGYNPSIAPVGNYYASFSGTSAATPICAGHMGIIHEMFTDGLFGNPLPLPATPANRFENKPHMSTSKALLCGTARPYPQAQILRRTQGWGFPDLARVYDNRKKMVVIDEYITLQQGQSRLYIVWVAPGQADFRATMVYTDPAAIASAAIHRVNNLNLKVQRFSDGTIWWGNNGLGIGQGDWSTPGGVPNDRDTIESVYLQNPTDGMYIVTVEAASVVQDAHLETPQLDADFALVIQPTGGGFLDDTAMTVDLASTGPGDLSLTCANVPATGWDHGFTFLSINTLHARGFGRFFGVEDDFLTLAIFTLGVSPGSVFHFTNVATNYPFVPFTFDPPLVSSLAGLRVDAQVTLWNVGAIFAQSNVDRITIQ